VETGIIGFAFLALFLGIIAIAYIMYLHKRNKTGQTFQHETFLFFVFAVSILAHSFIDFDMKYVYIASAVFFAFGVLSRHVHFQLPKLQNPKSVPWIVMIFAVISLFFAGRLFIAQSSFQKSVSVAKSTTDFYTIVKPLNTAASLSKNPDYLRQKLVLYQQAYDATKNDEFRSVAMNTVEKIQRHAYYDLGSYHALLNFYSQNQMRDEAKALLDKALALFPWEISIYDRAIAMNLEWGNQEPGRESWDQAIAIYDQVLEKVHLLDQIPDGQLKGRPFNVTNSMAINVAQILYFKGQYERAAETLQPFVNEEMTGDDRPTVRFYLASLQKLGKPDEALHNAFIAKYPDEKIQIDMLVNQTR
jgi:hypothetical protein